MHNFTEIARTGLAPVIRLDDPGDAVPLAQALKVGGVPLAEITLRTGAAGPL